MSRSERSSRHPAPRGLTLPPAEREFARKLEMRHGVILRLDEHEGGIQARHWKDDTVLADADTVYELETVLKSLHIYADDGVAPADIIPSEASS